MRPIVLENNNLRLSFDPANGTLCGLCAPELNWDVFDRPELGLSFRLLVPISEEKRNNNVFGEQQQLTSYDLSADGKELTLVWNGVVSQSTGKLDINVALIIEVTENEALFHIEIDNHSPYMVESVWYPYLGDVQHPPTKEKFGTFQYFYASAFETELWPHFHNQKGYFGVDYPTQFGPAYTGVTPIAPYILLRTSEMGLYWGLKSKSYEIVAWHAELRPGFGNSMDESVPEGREIAGAPVHIRFAAVHMPYIQPGETRKLTTIMLRAYHGDWPQGVDIYTSYRNSWLKPFSPPTWATEPHAWQQIHINSPEDELRLRFTDLPEVAAECCRYGVKAIQLVGWNSGGQDQGNPSHDYDHRLGTYEELKNAILECQKLGVKVILFSKFVWADRSTEWFRKELNKYSIKDPYGDYYMHGGYQYQTPAQLLNINTKRLIPMCFLSTEYRRIAQNEFLKLIDLGADGMLFDECSGHMPTWVCFDTSHKHRYGAPVFENDCLLIDEFRKLPGVPVDFLMAGEACYDWEMEQYQLSYHRSESEDHIPLSRYMLPNSQLMTAVTGFDDRNMINQCLMYRYIISYEPYNFKGRLSDFPDTLTYGMKMDALRTDLRKWFWDGEFRFTCGVKVVTIEGEPFDTYSVFLAQDGSYGAVIVNYDNHSVSLRISSDYGNFSRYRLVEDPQWRQADLIELPAESAAVII